MENPEKQPNFIAQVATILSFFTSIIQIIVVIIVLNANTAQTKYTERQYLMIEKIIEKQQEIANNQEQQLIRLDNMLRVIHAPAQ